MQERWVLKRISADYKRLAQELGVDPVIVRLMVNRGYRKKEEMEAFLHISPEHLYDPHLLKDGEKAVQILIDKIQQKKKIRIMGDYDIDGVMATYILTTGLEECGALIDTVIPDRITDGYGLNENLIYQAKEEAVDTIITCDNGIAAARETALAKELGMTVIVTDHHEIPTEIIEGTKRWILPEADAILNPKQQGDLYPCSDICGAVVAYKLIQLLYEAVSFPENKIEELMEFAGFATIGDVMDLRGENRIFAKLGIEKLNKTNNFGLKALCDVNEIPLGSISAYHVGFRLGPCINASGRLETAKISLRLLRADHYEEAFLLASEIKALNEERQNLTTQAVEQAKAVIEAEGYAEDTVIVVYLPTCHESIAGIVAGRIREIYYRPTLIVTKAGSGLKGSGRSIESYNMFEELSKCKALFTKFGGHKMAAGFSLLEENLQLLRERLNAAASVPKQLLIPKVVIDADMPIDYIHFKLIEELDLLEPFGKGNEKPIFAEKDVPIIQVKRVGKEGKVLQLWLLNKQNQLMKGVFFGDVEQVYFALASRCGEKTASEILNGRQAEEVCVNICYYPNLNIFRGETSIQIVIRSIQ